MLTCIKFILHVIYLVRTQGENMKKLVLLSCVFATLSAGLAHADADDNNCNKLNIMITNLSPNACTLINSTLRHGYFKYTSSVPMFLPAGTTTSPIILEQSVYGPELELTYACGENKLVTFVSKQNYCFLSAGDVYGDVTYKQNIDADYQATNGSWFWSQHGSINWAIR
jgi:hypothetical protein